MPHTISITSLANNAAMPTSVSGTINTVVIDMMERTRAVADAATLGGDPPPPPVPIPVPTPTPVVLVKVCIYDQGNNQVGQPVDAQVTGSSWSCSNIPQMSNGTYKLVAILNYDRELPTSDSRSGLHTP